MTEAAIDSVFGDSGRFSVRVGGVVSRMQSGITETVAAWRVSV